MKLFLDSANLAEIESCLKKGFLSGITTNPSILSKEPNRNFIEHIKEITKLCKKYNQLIPISVEVLATEPDEMIKQAHEFMEKIEYKNLNIKIPIGWKELEVIYALSKQGISINCTCLFNEAQCLMAVNAGARYVSLFYARLKDIGGNPCAVIRSVRELLDKGQAKAEIISGSIRHFTDVTEASIAGSHIVTASSAILQTMCLHPQTTKSVDGFLKDFESWLSAKKACV